MSRHFFTSESVTEGTREVGEACIEAMTQITVTGEHIASLNEAIQKVETALAENSENMRAMSAQMQKVRQEIADENAVLCQEFKF